MAEHFYSIHPDETLFISYNATQQQQQQQHQQMQQQLQQQQQQLHQLSSVVMGGQQPPSNNAANYLAGNAIEMDFTPGSNYFSTAAIDVNNNNCFRSSLRYFGNPPQNNSNNYNKVPAVLPKYTSSYMQQMQQQQHHMLTAVAAGTPTHHAPGLPLPQHTDANSSSICHYAHSNGNVSCFTRNRYTPYNHNRACAAAAAAAQNAASSSSLVGSTGITGFPFQQQQQLFAPIYQSGGGPPMIAAAVTATVAATPELKYTSTVVAPIVSCSVTSTGALPKATSANSIATVSSSASSAAAGNAIVVSTTTTSQPYINTTPPINTDPSQTVTLQITNLDYSMDEASLRSFLLSQLKPITPVVSLVFEGSSYAKVTVPDLYFAKQVVSYLHRKKIGHKRMLVSYTRDSSLTEINTLRCQVAGLLKDVPYYTLPMYKFRELFQSRFKTSISVLDLYKMQDICSITSDNNEEKFISLQPEMVNSLESSPLMEGLHHSVPYCTIHFKREQHKGWAEQEIEPLPNVFMTITEIQQIIYPLLKSHPGDIPVASLVHCIEGELSIQITTDESGVNLEHLVCCVQGIQIQMNNFGIKIIGWLELDKEGGGSSSAQERCTYSKNSTVSDPLYQISREVVELVKMSPKSTMKFNRFIPAYHNHFGKQCRVADYGYTKLIELFEALSSVVQIMGDGENRQITLTHRTQIRRFTSDLLRILRAHGNKSVLLSELPLIFAQTQSRSFDVTDYGVCDIVDILDGLVNSNIVVVTTVQNGKDILISIPKRKQTNSEIEKTCIFAGEMVELFSNAPQYTILFQKFVRSYHYHFAFQCRLSDYGFLKLADLMDAIHGVVEMEFANEEDKKVSLSPKVARRVFAEQCKELIRSVHTSSQTPMKLDEVLKLHKKKFGYQMQAQTLGVKELCEAVEVMPFTEMYESDKCNWIVCHNDNKNFRIKCYRACKFLLAYEIESKNNNSSNNETNNDAHSPQPKPADTKSLLKLKDFLEKFNEKYKNEDKLTESTVKAMKPLIEIVIENDNQHVQISKCMKFLMKVIVLLEQRHTMILHEIKNVLDCTISTCFEFGYPNLFSLLEAFPDIFTVKIGITQERSEITLLRTTEMRISSLASHQHLFGSIKLPSTKQKPMHHSSRTPLSDYNNRTSSLQGPPTKTRAICSDSFNNTTHHYQQQQQLTKALIVTPQPQPQQQAVQFCTAKIPTSYNSSNTTNNSSIYSTASQQSNIFNTSASNTSGGSNKENISNSSLNMFNISSNSSTNSSFNELNLSTGSNIITPAPPSISAYSAKLWDRRHNNQNYYQVQHHQHRQHDSAAVASIAGGLHPLIMPPPPLLSSQQLAITQPLSAAAPPQPMHDHQPPSTLYELVSNIQMCPMFEPPKPDTPPSDNMPFWIDPIWANNNSLAKANRNETLNIKLPELKNHNVLPMLFSPYTLSKTENMKKQVFNFENHDRKIA